MVDKRILVAVPSCHALRHWEQAVRETWGKDVPAEVDLRFFLGDRAGIHDSALHPYAADEVHLSVPDDWAGITKKTVAIFRWALSQGYTYVWKADLDTLVRPMLLLSSGLDQYDWVGGQNSHFASGGAGYGLSRRAMECVVNWPITQTCAEDLHTAEALLSSGIQLHHDPRFKFIPGASLEPEDVTYHLSSVRAWDAKYTPAWMYEAWNAKGTYCPLREPKVENKRWLRRLR